MKCEGTYSIGSKGTPRRIEIRVERYPESLTCFHKTFVDPVHPSVVSNLYRPVGTLPACLDVWVFGIRGVLFEFFEVPSRLLEEGRERDMGDDVLLEVGPFPRVVADDISILVKVAWCSVHCSVGTISARAS